MGPATRAVQTAIGLVAELKAAHQEGNDPESVEEQNLDTSGKDEDDANSEDDQNFGGGQTTPTESDSSSPVDEPPQYSEKDFAVVIPQRRPGSKSRGFLRAYAPVLAGFDLDEQTFLTFLKSFHKASQASPIFNTITIGAGAIGHISEPFTIAISVSISVLSGTAAEIQSRYRTNTFLDQANESLFKPRGLYCLIMSLRPNDMPKDNVGIEPVDTSSTVLKWLDPNKATFRAKLRDSSGTTHGEQEMPETAPLIYPDTGYAELGRIGSESGEKIGEFSKYQKVVENYFDKRAQAKYAYKHPDSTLATQEKPHFASKYGDPTNPSVTMNYYGRIACKIDHESLAERQARRRARALEVKRRGGGVRRLLKSSVLYLMIVNLPSEEEAAEVKKAMEGGSST